MAFNEINSNNAATRVRHDNPDSGQGQRMASGSPSRSDSLTEDEYANLLHGWYIDCCDYYADSFRRAPSVGIRRDIAMIIRNGMTAECLNAIMDETQRAFHPSWNYCIAIVKRCQGKGIRTLKDWLQDKAQRMQEQNQALRFNERAYQDGDFGPDFFRRQPSHGKPARQNPALNYEQRTYKDEDFGDDFFVDLSKCGEKTEDKEGDGT